MLTNKKHTLSCKAWIEYKGKPLIGKGGAEILEAIDKENSISKAAETLRNVLPLRLELHPGNPKRHGRTDC